MGSDQGAISGLEHMLAPDERDIPPAAQSTSLKPGIKCFSKSRMQANAATLAAGGAAGRPAATTRSSRPVVPCLLPTPPQRALFLSADQPCRHMHQLPPKTDYSCWALTKNEHSKTFKKKKKASQQCERT